MPKEILGPTNNGFDHSKKIFISGAYNSCGAHCIAIVFAELLLSGALEKNYLLETEVYKQLLQIYQEVYPENSVNDWNGLKKHLINISKHNNIEVQEHLGVVIRKFSAKILSKKTRKFYKEFKHNINSILDSIILQPDRDIQRYITDLDFDDVDDLRDWAGLNFVELSPYSEKTYEMVFARYMEMVADCNAGVMYTEAMLVETAKNLAFATQIYGPNRMTNTTSPVNPIFIVKIWNVNGAHWEIQQILTSAEKEQLRVTAPLGLLVEEIINDHNYKMNKLISLGYPKLLAIGVIKQFKYDNWLDYLCVLMEDPDITNEWLECYNVELMQTIITGVDFNKYLDMVISEEQLIIQYSYLTTVHPKMLPQEILLYLAAIKLNIESNCYGQEPLIVKLKNPAYYSEIKKTCQDIFNVLPNEIQQKIYQDTNDYMVQYKMKSIEKALLLTASVTPKEKLDSPKSLPPSICYQEDVFVPDNLNLTLLDGTIIEIEYYKNLLDKQKNLVAKVVLKNQPEIVLMIIEKHVLRFPLAYPGSNCLSEQQMLVLLESLKILSNKSNPLAVKVINFKETDLLRLFEKINYLNLFIKFEFVRHIENKQLEATINMHNYSVEQVIQKKLQQQSGCRLS